VSGRGVVSLFQSTYKNFKRCFIKACPSVDDPTLLNGFPLYWTPKPHFQSASRLENLDVKERGICELLEGLKVVFDTSTILTREYDLGLFKAYMGIYLFGLAYIFSYASDYENLYSFLIAEKMLSTISKDNLTTRMKKMMAAKESVVESKGELGGLQIESEHDEETTSGLIRKNRGLEVPVPSGQSHSDGRGLEIQPLPIQDHIWCSSKVKASLWDPDFDILTHNKSVYLMEDDIGRVDKLG